MARILISLALCATAAATGLALATPAFAGDAKAGQATFKTNCAVCHSDNAKSPPGIGPRLFGVIGRQSGTFPGYSYSPAMKAVGYAWTKDKIAAYLKAPATVIPGNRMPFAGLKGGQKAEDVAEYLATLK